MNEAEVVTMNLVVPKLQSLGKYVRIRTGKLDANANNPDGKYPFFTCAVTPLRIATFSFDCECVLIAGNGDLNVKYHNGKFDAYQRTYVIESLDKNALDVRYLYHFLEQYVVYLRHLSIGGVIKYIKLEYLTEAEIPLPPLAEQKRIAAILDEADALRRKRRAALTKLDALLQSVFLDMFGDPVTNSKGWNVGSIEIVADDKSDIRCGPFGTQLKVDELVDSGIPLLGIENVHSGRFNPNSTKFLTEAKAKQLSMFDVKPGDVLITRMGTIGRACVVPQGFMDARISYHLFRVRPNPQKCLPDFLAATISRSGTFQAQLKQMAHGAIMAGLNTNDLKNVKFLLPPVQKQNEYVTTTQAVDAQLQQSIKSLRSLDALFSSLQNQAFSSSPTDTNTTETPIPPCLTFNF